MNRLPMMDRIMIAATETTIQLQALRAETTGFMMGEQRRSSWFWGLRWIWRAEGEP